MTNLPLLEIIHLAKKYDGKPIVRNLSFCVYSGEVVGLLGPNGAGKTTAFYMTIGLIKADRGEVRFKQKKINHLPVDKRAKMGMGYLAQEPSVFRHLTVEENLLCILQILPLTKKEIKGRLKELLQELNLEHLAKKKAYSLSGGERRRLEITRALITNPCLLLLDEPFANIDPISVHEVKKLIVMLREKGISILITDHNARELFSIVDRGYLIQDGKVSLSGTAETLMSDEQARKTYFGEDFRL